MSSAAGIRAGDSDVGTLTLTERRSTTDTLASGRETETVNVGGESEAPEQERTPMTEEGKGDRKKNKPPLDNNIYSTKKTVANGMMDLALLSANGAQLKMILKFSQEKGQMYYAHITCLSLSIILQVIVGILLIVNSRYNINHPSEHSKAELMNNITVIGVFLITVINVLASSFDDVQ